MDAQMEIKPGYEVWQYAAGKLVIESTRFVWLPRYLPVVDNHSRWDGKAAKYLWLRWARLRGTEFGWETVVEARA